MSRRPKRVAQYRTPLESYLAAKGMTQAQFAQLYASYTRRKSVPIGQISNYVRGALKPSFLVRSAIQAITDGGIPIESWG